MNTLNRLAAKAADLVTETLSNTELKTPTHKTSDRIEQIIRETFAGLEQERDALRAEVEKLRHENEASLRKIGDYAVAITKECEANRAIVHELVIEREKLREDKERFKAVVDSTDILAEYSGFKGNRDWCSTGAWLQPNEAIAILDKDKFDAARKDGAK